MHLIFWAQKGKKKKEKVAHTQKCVRLTKLSLFCKYQQTC